MKFDLSLAGFLLSFVLGASGWFFRWNDKQKSDKQQDKLERQQAIAQAEAAAVKIANEQRDFNHLRNNQIQISQGIATGFKDIEASLVNGFKDTKASIDELKGLVTEIKSWQIRNQATARSE
ncbi:MAG: hypothetical protein ACYT04_39780 [Nostoc sp.]